MVTKFGLVTVKEANELSGLPDGGLLNEDAGQTDTVVEKILSATEADLIGLTNKKWTSTTLASLTDVKAIGASGAFYSLVKIDIHNMRVDNGHIDINNIQNAAKRRKELTEYLERLMKPAKQENNAEVSIYVD